MKNESLTQDQLDHLFIVFDRMLKNASKEWNENKNSRNFPDVSIEELNKWNDKGDEIFNNLKVDIDNYKLSDENIEKELINFIENDFSCQNWVNKKEKLNNNFFMLDEKSQEDILFSWIFNKYVF